MGNNKLRDLRLSHSLSSQELVDTVKELYPKYDKPLQSKCEQSDVYGVRLNQKAMNALLQKYDPDGLLRRKRSSDGHRLICKIQCRLEDDVYAELLHKVKTADYKTVQDWMTDMVLMYIGEPE